MTTAQGGGKVVSLAHRPSKGLNKNKKSVAYDKSYVKGHRIKIIV